MSNENTLFGRLIPLPESEEDDGIQDIDNDVNAYILYAVSYIIDSIGTSESFNLYLAEKDEIDASPINVQIDICNQILEKLYEVYSFEFPMIIEINNKDEIGEIFTLFRFLEYDNQLFLSKLWVTFREDLRKLDIEKYCTRKGNDIIREIEILSEFKPRLVKLFLRTNNKQNMLDFIIKKTIENKMNILMESELLTLRP